MSTSSADPNEQSPESTSTAPTPPGRSGTNSPSALTLSEKSVQMLTEAAESEEVSPHWRGWHTLALFIITGLIFLIGLRLEPDALTTTWLSIMLLLVAFSAIAGKGIVGQWRAVLIDEHNMISLSRMQMFLWTVLVLGGFLTAGLANMQFGAIEPLAIEMPQELWLLMGITTTTLAAAPLVQKQKEEKKLTTTESAVASLTISQRSGQKPGDCQIINKGELIAYISPDCASWADMFRGDDVSNGSHLDLSKVQLFFFTIILLFAYAMALNTMFSVPSGVIEAFPVVDSSIVTLLGISHAGFLASQAT